MTDSYTPEELESLPQTPTVFDRPSLAFDEHDWVQEGYMIRDNCSLPKMTCEPVGIPIPSGKTLVKVEGAYDLVDEHVGR